MNRKILLILFLTCLSLSAFSRPAMANFPTCGCCETPSYPYGCVPVYCGGGCVYCTYSSCSCQLCGGSDPNLTCCNGGCCNTGDKSKCLSCVPGLNCVACDGDPNQECCAGAKKCRHWRTEQCCWNTWWLWATICDKNLGCCYGVCYDQAKKKCCDDGPPGYKFYVCDINDTCCNGSCCDTANCRDCNSTTHVCDNKCKPELCQECDGHGNCVVCGGDTEQECCLGSCCYKVWTKETEAATVQTCGSCQNSLALCNKQIFNTGSYEQCKIEEEPSSDKHCQCHEKMQVVGYADYCNENWDVSKLLWCAARGAWCAAVCVYTMEAELCADCLMEAGADCCDGSTCELCDFVEECYPAPEYLTQVLDYVFKNFDCMPE